MKRINAKNIISKRSFEKKASGYIQELSAGRYLEPSIVKLSDRDCWSFFIFNEWVNSTVNRIVADCVKVKPLIVPIDRSKDMNSSMDSRRKEIMAFLSNPNQNKESFREIREKCIRDLLVFGRSSIEKVNDKKGKLSEIYSVYSPDIRINADGHGNLPAENAYAIIPQASLKTPSETKYFDINEMIFIILQPTSGTVYGMKPLDSLANAVAADIMRATYNMNFFLNNGEVSGILGMTGMSKTDLKRFREYWNANFKGFKQAHKIAAVNVPVNWVSTAVLNRDMQFQEYGEEIRTKIFAAYNMQPVVMGIIDKSTGKLNTHEQIELYKDGALRPILEKEAYHYTEEIINKGLGIKDLELIFSGIDLAERSKQSEIDIQNVTTGIITINEARANLGLSPVPWGITPISLNPGGLQIDPETGRIQGQNQENNKPQDEQTTADDGNKKLDFYIKSSKIKISSIIDYFKDDIPKCEYGYRTKVKDIFVNGKKYVYNVNTFPVEMKNSTLYKVLTVALNPENLFEDNDARRECINGIESGLKHIVIETFFGGTKKNLLDKIDKYIIDFESTDLFKETFG